MPVLQPHREFVPHGAAHMQLQRRACTLQDALQVLVHAVCTHLCPLAGRVVGADLVAAAQRLQAREMRAGSLVGMAIMAAQSLLN